ncbi:MAG: hypothetical protein ACYTHJ_10885 [Planctomycetota bacterium]
MIPCEKCEYFERDGFGNPVLRCDPYTNIKETECLAKHQLLKLDTLAQSHQATLDMYRRLAPLQEKMMRHVEREIDEAEDADSWKYDESEVDPDSRLDDDDDDPFQL